ncbi:hypothetical protein RUM43_005860 [Polyplax serrata]|uniref:Uncharacterized protein n=1 Tax=Polyplax serrata TaxID=468196 RepID=A0AAN8PA69_POLSC
MAIWARVTVTYRAQRSAGTCLTGPEKCRLKRKGKKPTGLVIAEIFDVRYPWGPKIVQFLNCILVSNEFMSLEAETVATLERTTEPWKCLESLGIGNIETLEITLGSVEAMGIVTGRNHFSIIIGSWRYGNFHRGSNRSAVSDCRSYSGSAVSEKADEEKF